MKGFISVIAAAAVLFGPQLVDAKPERIAKNGREAAFIIWLAFLSAQSAAVNAEYRLNFRERTGSDVKARPTRAVQRSAAVEDNGKEAYERRAEEIIKGYDDALIELRKKPQEVAEAAEAEFEEQMAALESKVENAKRQLERLRSAAGEAWEAIRSRMDAALDDLDNAYDAMLSRFK
jgi:hypothetical protein